MGKDVIFFQGGAGKEDHEADANMVASLQEYLGATYTIHYPFLPEEKSPDFGRREQIGDEITVSKEDVILVGHSLGASMLLVYLSENKVMKKIAGLFLMSTPFWSGYEDWVQPFKLQEDFAEKLPKQIPIFFYHCRDDEEVPFGHLAIYRQFIPWAFFREIPSGGHQLNKDLTIVANDIKSL